ncbi:hypothetical protein C3F00_041430, partial [Pseudomonas sp. MWU13-2860]
GSGKRDAQIARAIIAMAHRLNLGVIAEGVETHEQLAFLRENGHALDPLYLALWGIPTAMFAFLIHAGRLAWHEYRISRAARAEESE